MAVASLGMYDGETLRDANDLLWSLIAERLRENGVAGVPSGLDRRRPLDAIWSDPDLLLAQCCGYPLVTRYRDRLRYVATPCYGAPGCSDTSHRSRIVVRADDAAVDPGDLRGRRAAMNERQSNTGMNLLRGAIAPLARDGKFFGSVVETGSHQASAGAVAEGQADVAAIDSVTFAHIARGDPSLVARLRTIAWTEEGPGLPFVTSIATPDWLVELLRSALVDVVRDATSRPARDVLLLRNVKCLPPQAYDRLLHIADVAARHDYPELA